MLRSSHADRLTLQIVIGINSKLTKNGDNENIRVLDWTSSGYKPPSNTSTVEKVTDFVKEQVKNDEPGENKRDVDVQEIKSVAQASSVTINDLEQYIVSNGRHATDTIYSHRVPCNRE